MKKGELPSVWTTVILTIEEQFDIIKKLQEDGFFDFANIDEKGAFVVLKDIENENTEEVSLKNGILYLNKNTGLVKLNEFENVFNPTSEEFRIIYSLFNNKDNSATYKQLLGDKNSKSNIRQLGFKIRNIKKFLGILPAKKAKNKDIIGNIKGYGYKLIK